MSTRAPRLIGTWNRTREFADRQRAGDVELYEEARYLTMTGAHLSLTPPDIRERSETLAAVHADVVADRAETDPSAVNSDAAPESPGESMGIGPEPSISDSSAPETAERGRRHPYIGGCLSGI